MYEYFKDIFKMYRTTVLPISGHFSKVLCAAFVFPSFPPRFQNFGLVSKWCCTLLIFLMMENLLSVIANNVQNYILDNCFVTLSQVLKTQMNHVWP